MKHRHKCISKEENLYIKKLFYTALVLILHCTLYKCNSIIPQVFNRCDPLQILIFNYVYEEGEVPGVALTRWQLSKHSAV